MKLNEIETFVAVAESRSVQDAALRLHLTQSAVSRLIQRFESEMGSELFNRKTKPFRLTRAGENALVHCRRVLRAVDDFSSDFSDTAPPAGPFRLGLSHALASFVARGPVEHLRKSFTGLSISVIASWSKDLMSRVVSGDLEAAVVMLAADGKPSADLLSRRLSMEQVQIIAPHDLDPDHTGSIEAMNNFGWILLPEGCRYRTTLRRSLERSSRPLNVAVESFGQELLLTLVGRGAGIGLAPPLMFRDTPFESSIRVVACPEFRLDVSVWLVRGRYPGRFSPAMDVLEARFLDIMGHDRSVSA